MANWGRKIVIAEPAPGAARVARYAAPHYTWKEVDALDALGPIIVLFGGAIVFGVAGGGVAAIAAALFGGGVEVPVWVCFDLLLVSCVVASYILVARYGLRFPADKDSGRWHIMTEQGNTAWRCLPTPQRLEYIEHLRAMNAAARLVLIDPDDAEACQVLEHNARTLHDLTLSRLPEQGSHTTTEGKQV
ncbi:hypothetical protein [Streptomyces capuensis]|uniref:hypothetical protein n=1 Tax=Streptomyces capuensis TaxID=1464056 RepID=UPI0004C0B22E|nr:hypothetical protein [Streptomyces capuensis]